MLAGPLVSWIIGALEGVVVVYVLSAIGASLLGLGSPKGSILRYEPAIKTDKFILIIHGTADEATHAKEVITPTNPETLDHHQYTHEKRVSDETNDRDRAR